MIEQPYLLVMSLPCYIDDQGQRYFDELWHKDLVAHLAEMADLRLASPLRREAIPPGAVPIDPTAYPGRITFIDLPPCASMMGTLRSLPKLIGTLWRAVGEARIVHANAGGWPISFAWIAIPIARLRGKFSLTNVESGGWRLGLRWPWKPKPLLQGLAFELGARACVNASNLATFTHSGYLDSMMIAPRKHRGHVVSASWIEQENILPVAEAEALWARKLEDQSRPLRLVFAASLQPSKGVATLLEALRLLEQRDVPVELDLYGKGPMLGDCEAAASSLQGRVTLRLKGTMAYGPPFFAMLRDYDAMVVPSISDEQPRVIFDAFSQSLPVIGSDTPGVLECVTDGRDGKISRAGDPGSLADAIAWAAANRDELAGCGIRALDVAANLTHDRMHANRAAIIEAALGGQAVGSR
jgi:glycosyltransferase involved in cell wall biosynthesis